MTHQDCHPEPYRAKGLKPWPCKTGPREHNDLDSSSPRYYRGSSEWQVTNGDGKTLEEALPVGS